MIVDLKDQRFGMLVAISYKRENGTTYWTCKCDCGSIVDVAQSSLRRINSTSHCGCRSGIISAQRSTKPDSASCLLYSLYKADAKRDSVEFHLLLDDFKKLIAGNCHYCDIMPSRIKPLNAQRKNHFIQPLVYNGIDKVDPKAHYIINNCVSCCYVCNRAKSDMSYDEFIEWIERMSYHQSFGKFAGEMNLTKKLLWSYNYPAIDDERYFTVVEQIGRRYKCECCCGKVFEVPIKHVESGARKSCGCMKAILVARAKSKPNGEAQVNKLYYRYKTGAKKRDMDFNVSIDEFFDIIQNDCTYCGGPPRIFELYRPQKMDDDITSIYWSGIDRVNSDLGYTLDNMVACCKICNRAKSSMPLDEFMSWLKTLSGNLVSLRSRKKVV